MNLKYLSLAVPFFFILTGCQSEQPITTAKNEVKTIKVSQASDIKIKPSLTNLDGKKTEFNALIKNKECDSTNQCQILPVGSRACGGPSQYVVYSNKHVDSKKAQALALQITNAEKVFNEKNKMMSICQHLTKPAAQ